MISERLRQKIAQHQICIGNKCFNFTVSIGVSSLKPQQTDLQLLIRKPTSHFTKPNKAECNCVISYAEGMSEPPEPIF